MGTNDTTFRPDYGTVARAERPNSLGAEGTYKPSARPPATFFSFFVVRSFVSRRRCSVSLFVRSLFCCLRFRRFSFVRCLLSPVLPFLALPCHSISWVYPYLDKFDIRVMRSRRDMIFHELRPTPGGCSTSTWYALPETVATRQHRLFKAGAVVKRRSRRRRVPSGAGLKFVPL